MKSIKQGSSGIPVIIDGKTVKKIGPVDRISAERRAYQRLQGLLGTDNRTLARVVDYYEEAGQATLIIERLPGRDDLEEYILTTADEKERLIHINKVIVSVITLLKKWQEIRSNEEPGLLFEEIVQALENAWQRSGQDNILCNWPLLKNFLNQSRIKSLLLQGIKLGPCHRDLCTNNIWPLSDGGLRVFDPHWALTGSQVTSAGHIILDLASLRINLERLQADRERKGLNHKLPIELVDDFISQLIAENHLNQLLADLVFLRRYLSFTVCRCQHCLAPERSHRFQLMEERARKISYQLISNLRKI